MKPLAFDGNQTFRRLTNKTSFQAAHTDRQMSDLRKVYDNSDLIKVISTRYWNIGRKMHARSQQKQNGFPQILSNQSTREQQQQQTFFRSPRDYRNNSVCIQQKTMKVFNQTARISSPLQRNRQPTFVFKSSDSVIQRVLVAEGWKEVKARNFAMFNIKWVAEATPMDYVYLKPEQKFNHIKGFEECLKLQVVLKRLKLKNIDHEKFIPRCFDMPSEFDVFNKDWEKTAILCLLKKHISYFKIKCPSVFQTKLPVSLPEMLQHSRFTSAKINNFLVNIPILVQTCLYLETVLIELGLSYNHELIINLDSKSLQSIISYSRLNPPYEQYADFRHSNLSKFDTQTSQNRFSFSRDYQRYNSQDSMATPSKQLISLFIHYHDVLTQKLPWFSSDGCNNMWFVLNQTPNWRNFLQVPTNNRKIVPNHPCHIQKAVQNQFSLSSSKSLLFRTFVLAICRQQTYQINMLNKHFWFQLPNFSQSSLVKGKIDQHVQLLEIRELPSDVENLKRTYPKQIQDIIVSCFDGLRPSERKKGCFNLFEMTSVVDSNFTVWLQDINTNVEIFRQEAMAFDTAYAVASDLVAVLNAEGSSGVYWKNITVQKMEKESDQVQQRGIRSSQEHLMVDNSVIRLIQNRMKAGRELHRLTTKMVFRLLTSQLKQAGLRYVEKSRDRIVDLRLAACLLQRLKVEQDFDEERYFDQEQQENKPTIELEEEDELDMYMRGLESQGKQQDKNKEKPPQVMFEADPVDDFYQSLKKKAILRHKAQRKQKQKSVQNGMGSKEDSDLEDCEFLDSDGEVDLEKLKKGKKKIEVLEPLDFSNIKLEAFQKNFYSQNSEITSLPQEKIKQYRNAENMKVKGRQIPRPIMSFGYLGFSQQLLDLISRNNFEKPTPIQAQALPIALSGRDVVGIAKTGSGKTLAYVWPMIIHVLDQRQLQKNEGPIGLILAPTRQLCQQIFIEANKYCKKFNISVGCLLGGQNKHEQWKILKAGVDILIASPGRLIEMIKKKATNLLRVTYLVIDQADKLFSLGFEMQLRSIIGQTRQDRQTLLFTATLRKSVQGLVADFLIDPITITIGEENQANQDIKQEFRIVPDLPDKDLWLQKNIESCLSRGKVLIFVNQINSCNHIQQLMLKKHGLVCLSLHGDKNQFQRTTIINTFKTKEQLMVATDVASRGLDVRQIKTVINYDPPKDSDTYIHRIGRTGRAGDRDGQAITLLLETDWKIGIMLIRILESSCAPVPPDLEDVAMKDDKFRLKRLSSKMGVSFAKGKDATKLLNQALKRQRNSNIKAGIGYVEPDLIHRDKKNLEMKDVFEKHRGAMRLDSSEDPIQLAHLNQFLQAQNQKRKDTFQLREGMKTKFGGTFVSASNMKSQSAQWVTVTYADRPNQPQKVGEVHQPIVEQPEEPAAEPVRRGLSRWSTGPT